MRECAGYSKREGYSLFMLLGGGRMFLFAKRFTVKRTHFLYLFAPITPPITLHWAAGLAERRLFLSA